MRATRAVILISDEKAVSSKSFSDACSLAQSASQTIQVIGSVPNDIRKIAQSHGFLSTNKIHFPETKIDKSKDIYSQLNEYPLKSNLLVVVIGNSADLNMYISSRLGAETKRILQWHIVSSNYARYALLEQQRSLSTYIPRDTATWLRQLIKSFGRKEILATLDGIRSLNTLVIGETIVDEYIYCNALGKVSKDPMVAFEIGTKISQLGGILAVAKHVSGLGAKTSVCSQVAKADMKMIINGIGSNIDLSQVLKNGDRTLKKIRYVDRASNVRVFETYEMPSTQIPPGGGTLVGSLTAMDLQNYDLAIVVDYGHGLIDEGAIASLVNSGVFLAANAQSNAGNRGFNPIARYIGAPMIFLNGSEVEVETRTRSKDLVSTVEILAKNLETKEFYVTNGSGGLVCWQDGQPTISVPAFAPSVVDRTGAGDALLSMIALLRKSGAPRDIAIFFGNIAGALLISSMGNEISLSHDLVWETADEILSTVGE